MKHPGRWVVFGTAVIFVLIGTVGGMMGADDGYATGIVSLGGFMMFCQGIYVACIGS